MDHKEWRSHWEFDAEHCPSPESLWNNLKGSQEEIRQHGQSESREVEEGRTAGVCANLRLFIPSAGTWKPKAENVISRIGTKQERDSNVVLPHTTVSVGGMSILTSAQARPLGNENLALGR